MELVAVVCRDLCHRMHCDASLETTVLSEPHVYDKRMYLNYKLLKDSESKVSNRVLHGIIENFQGKASFKYDCASSRHPENFQIRDKLR